MKNPAALSAHPYNTIQNAGNAQACKKSQPGQTMANRPAIKPTNNGANNPCATRRVGGDQNGSDSLMAWRRTSTNEPANAINPTPAQKPINPCFELIFKTQPAVPPAMPTTPLKIITGASALR